MNFPAANSHHELLSSNNFEKLLIHDDIECQTMTKT